MVIFLKAYAFLINTENLWSIVRRTITYKFIYMTSRYRYCVLYQNKQPVLRTTLNYIHVINKQIKLLIPRKTNKRYFKQLIHIYLWNKWYNHKSSSKYILKIVVIFFWTPCNINKHTCTIISQDNPSFYGERKSPFSMSTIYVVLSWKQ